MLLSKYKIVSTLLSSFFQYMRQYQVCETQNIVYCVVIRAVKVNALIYEIIVAEINAIKYFNAVNATLFTSGLLCYFR